MNKRLMALLLVLCMLLCACAPQENTQDAPQATEAAQAANQNAETQPQETAEEDPFAGVNELEPDASGVYQVHSAEGLVNMAKNPQGKFVLLQDIDMAGAGWTPVGTDAAPFTGSFDGNGFVISNLVLAAGADGNTGFFGVNKGTVKNLKLDGVTLDVTAGLAGTVAAVNQGTIENCNVLSGAMTVGGNAVAGGLVGKCESGSLVRSESGVRIEAEASATVGLLGGQLKNITMENCIYSGPMNRKNGEIFTNFAGEEADVTYTGCLWRDNSNSSELLPQKAQQMRDTVEQRMRAQGSVEWTVDANISFVSHNNHHVVGETYYGVPYTNMGASLDRFNYCFNEDGTLKDFAKINWIADDQAELYMGTDCSGAVYWAWAAVSPSTVWRWTNDMLPVHNNGGIAIGGYDGEDTHTTTLAIYEANGSERMLENFVLARKGDGAVTYFSNEPGTGRSNNHIRMMAQDPVILRDADGKIDTDASYCIMHGQGDGIFSLNKTTWVIDEKFTLTQLLNDYYVPVSNQELLDGNCPDCWVKVDNEKTGKAYLTTGTVESNYRLDSVTIKITDEDGNVAWEQTMFTAIHKYATAKTNYNARTTIRSFNLANFAAHIGEMELEAGKTYTYELSAVPGTGETFVLKTFEFVQ